MPRGGRRPGAGAPKGNLNALKTGTRSTRVMAIMQALAHDEESRLVLTHLAARGNARAGKFREIAGALVRFIHDHPVAAEISRRLDEVAATQFAAHEARETDRLVAEYEQFTLRDVFTGRKLNRTPLKTPEQKARTARLRARVDAYRKIQKAAEAVAIWEAALDGKSGYIPVLDPRLEDPTAEIKEMITATRSALTKLPKEGPFS